MSTLEKAIKLATEVHTGQLDKGGQPYILHPLRVMLKMQTNEERIVAVLHDVLEDGTALSLYQSGFSENIVEAVKALTRGKRESYEDYIARLAPNQLARTVKLRDLEDNMDLQRIPIVSSLDLDRWRKYALAKWNLLSYRGDK